ncbi:MAG: hypothetical protein A2166_05495 [Omnitrophica WOR_2 bacterium RBG_13_41_10]|nr:MAG: hypothetical protein A2166_05495 [Omnitrophica WOR_2 bacterium RBG_13_41_10]
MLDKRNYKRFSYENSIFLKLEKDPSNIIEGKLLDISFLGMSIFLKENVNVDSLVQAIVQFDSPISLEKHLIGKGKVVYVKKQKFYAEDGFGIGVEFVEVDKEVVLSILDRLEAKIIDERKKQSQIPRKNPGPF